MKQSKLIVDFSKAQSRSKIISSQPILSSDSLQWPGLNFNYYQCQPQELPKHYEIEHSVVVNLNSVQIEHQLRGQYRIVNKNYGSICIIPSMAEDWASWQDLNEFILLSICPLELAQFVAETGISDKIELQAQINLLQDPLIMGIATTFKYELETTQPNDSDELLYEHLKNALLAHLLQKYCFRQDNSHQDLELSPQQIKLVLNYIHDNLAHKIKIADLAALVGLSPGYFSRLFQGSLGVSPYRFILQKRVKKAQALLRQLKTYNLSDLALKSGFSSPTQLTRQFKKFVGMSPEQYHRTLD